MLNLDTSVEGRNTLAKKFHKVHARQVVNWLLRHGSSPRYGTATTERSSTGNSETSHHLCMLKRMS